MITDKQLYQMFLNGNMNSFEELVIRHKNGLIYFVQRYVKDFSIAEDIVQDAFVYVLEHKNKYNFKYELKTYLYMISKCRALNYLKREKKILKLNEELYVNDDELEEKIFIKSDLAKLKDTITKLKPDYQSVIYLIDIEGISYKDTSKILKKSLSNVKVLIHRARKELSNLIGKEINLYEE